MPRKLVMAQVQCRCKDQIPNIFSNCLLIHLQIIFELVCDPIKTKKWASSFPSIRVLRSDSPMNYAQNLKNRLYVSGFLYANHVISQSGGSEVCVANECFHHKRCAILTWQIRNVTAANANYQLVSLVHKREWVSRRKPKRLKVKDVV